MTKASCRTVLWCKYSLSSTAKSGLRSDTRQIRGESSAVRVFGALLSTASLNPKRPSTGQVTSPALERYPLTQGVNPWLVTVAVRGDRAWAAPPRGAARMNLPASASPETKM